jgi:tetratricopeptide (TPR) repeat protein
MAALYITDFIQSLSSEEVKIVREYVYKSNEKVSSNENKIGKLLDILVKDPDKQYTDIELSSILASNSSTLRVLKSRLFDKAKEALVSDKHFENTGIFNHRERTVFILKKRVLLIKSLYRTQSQRRIQNTVALIFETIKIARENQIYDVLIEMLIFQKHITGIRKGYQEYEKISTEIEFYNYCFKSVQYAFDCYYKLILNNNTSAPFTDNELKEHVQKSIRQMEIDFKKTKAQEVNYFLHIFKITLYEHQKNFKQSIVYCKYLLTMLKKSNVLYSRDRIGFALANLTQFNVFIGNYKEASAHAKNAQKFHLNNSLNHLILKEQEFYSYFYSGNYTKAIKCIQEMVLHSSADTGEFRKSKFIYYQGCLLFADKQFKDAIQLLNKSLEIEKDKTGWNIALRVLMIMVFIELNKASETTTSIATLRKHIERTGKIKEIKQRDILILKLLRELEKDGFKRNEKNKTAVKLLYELSDKDKPTAWNYYTPELIPFHEWVKTLPEKVHSPT